MSSVLPGDSLRTPAQDTVSQLWEVLPTGGGEVSIPGILEKG